MIESGSGVLSIALVRKNGPVASRVLGSLWALTSWRCTCAQKGWPGRDAMNALPTMRPNPRRRARSSRVCTSGSQPRTRSRPPRIPETELQTLEVQIHVQPAEVVEQKIANCVGPHDCFGIAVVDRQEPRIVLLEECAIVRVGPQPIPPVGMVQTPGISPLLPFRREVSVFPCLMDQRGNLLLCGHSHSMAGCLAEPSSR